MVIQRHPLHPNKRRWRNHLHVTDDNQWAQYPPPPPPPRPRSDSFYHQRTTTRTMMMTTTVNFHCRKTVRCVCANALSFQGNSIDIAASPSTSLRGSNFTSSSPSQSPACNEALSIESHHITTCPYHTPPIAQWLFCYFHQRWRPPSLSASSFGERRLGLTHDTHPPHKQDIRQRVHSVLPRFPTNFLP